MLRHSIEVVNFRAKLIVITPSFVRAVLRVVLTLGRVMPVMVRPRPVMVVVRTKASRVQMLFGGYCADVVLSTVVYQ